MLWLWGHNLNSMTICHEYTDHYSCYIIFTVYSRLLTIVLLYWAPLRIWKDPELGGNLRTEAWGSFSNFPLAVCWFTSWDYLSSRLTVKIMQLHPVFFFYSPDDNQRSSLDISAFNSIGWFFHFDFSLFHFTSSIFHFSFCQYSVYLLLFLMSPPPLIFTSSSLFSFVLTSPLFRHLCSSCWDNDIDKNEFYL